jgi:hypothetical protein
MKDLFPGYYPLSDEEFSELWQQCFFIFDTNVLLEFYEHRNETRKDFFNVLDAIKDRLWIPHQVALEYHKNRITRIKKAESNFADAKKAWDQTLSNNFNSKCFPPEIVKEMRENAKKVFDAFWDKLAPCREELIQVDGTDYIRDKITDLFRGRIGKPPVSQAELDKIYLEGEQRYKIFRPPGFRDQRKEKEEDNYYIWNGLAFNTAYGDLILWKQILEQVKSNSLSHVIFITGDNKPDWWTKEKGKNIGRRELVEEILEAGACMFYMYQPEIFLKCAQKYLHLEVKEESIQQVEEVSISNNLSEPELEEDSFTELLTIEDKRTNFKSSYNKIMKALLQANLLSDLINSQTDFRTNVAELAEKVGISVEYPEK